jgi:hypothetical protein
MWCQIHIQHWEKMERKENYSTVTNLKVRREDIVIKPLHAALQEVAKDEGPLLHNPDVALGRIGMLTIL